MGPRTTKPSEKRGRNGNGHLIFLVPDLLGANYPQIRRCYGSRSCCELGPAFAQRLWRGRQLARWKLGNCRLFGSVLNSGAPLYEPQAHPHAIQAAAGRRPRAPKTNRDTTDFSCNLCRILPKYGLKQTSIWNRLRPSANRSRRSRPPRQHRWPGDYSMSSPPRANCLMKLNPHRLRPLIGWCRF